ncbi:SOS response-associated peptidase [Hazenella coriacea]|uniref:Abasic site processing protein n=1 Tax=Hazenella coriacea TaxID=1179467 RepID=A0A4R3L0N4_9BACL|nr:SOS response-associated peptidase [Hazenella coriacea]TCS93061.1 putative SOS response-associated peptidase YedK [Hazenella coriacea]
MCGRFSLFSSHNLLQERFQFEFSETTDWQPRYNIAPSQQVLAIIYDETKRKGQFLRWGLIPFWAKDQKIGYKLINARSETITEKSSFRHLISRKRCLILADGFYEWKKTKDGKQPYFIQLASGQPFAFAGLWDCWEKDDQIIRSCTLITTSPNLLMKSIHDRMPSILQPNEENAWLDPKLQDKKYLKSLLKPYPEEEMIRTPVSTLVNSPRNDEPDCMTPIGEDDLFFSN